MKAILIIIVLLCTAIFVSMGVQWFVISITMEGDATFHWSNLTSYSSFDWFLQIVWWILQLSLFIWAIIDLYSEIKK